MARITMEDCQAVIQSPFKIVQVAADRARQLHDGMQPTVEAQGHRPAVVALKEIAAGNLTSEGLAQQDFDEDSEY
ncbi:DNA-directed RNA polymerase subunit omega [Candidatus Comchoanobacter bicostacola]|uniref:DNA-directed RNA polymerase subunit omega n=1 Tax=Candidatus Comchoanobacter bicostacola TaxID=2919598 RepID=A0ABY5DKB1_9GAMM|nr:DNA-directed RNA polymerase subunit omega [Candidatus Comchoanobacter bicostacola]UTC24428.1 DNA-directed RNA polymerase subunit omega [Candidatus Comchoanobacter bicostacola]